MSALFLRRFKTKYIKELALYEPKSKHEAELRDMLIDKLEMLRAYTLPSFARLCHLVLKEDITEGLRSIVINMLRDLPLPEAEEGAEDREDKDEEENDALL